jgi:PAS domain S-box-containing protein
MFSRRQVEWSGHHSRQRFTLAGMIANRDSSAIRRKDPAAVLPEPAWPDPEMQLASIVEHSNDAIFGRRLDGIITTWNAAATRIFGYQPNEIIGRPSRVLLPRGHRDEFRQLLKRLRRGEVVTHFETERLRQDGQRIRVSLTLAPIRNATRRLLGFSTIARDITPQMEMREALAQRERELDDLFEEASIGLLMLSREGKVLRANRTFLELVDRPPAKVIGRSIKAFHPSPEQVAELLGLLAQRQTLHNYPTELLNRRRQLKSVIVDANALWENGRFVHSRWFVRDISQRRRLERELLALSDRERRSFAQELHDGLGQQLGGVAYLSNVLQQKLVERVAPEATDAARIFGLVRNAIAQTRRVARGLSPIELEPEGLMVALRELAEQTTDLFRVRCRFNCSKPVLLEDSSVTGHLYRIAQEAVNNALKHAQARAITIHLQRKRHRVILRVTDNGKGIAPVSPRRKGLGLRIMQYRASLLRGTFAVRPRTEGGTEVVCSTLCATAARRESGK